MFKLYDVIIANRELENVPKGSLGTILMVYENDDYEVEFLDEQGLTLNLLTVNARDLLHGNT